MATSAKCDRQGHTLWLTTLQSVQTVILTLIVLEAKRSPSVTGFGGGSTTQPRSQSVFLRMPEKGATMPMENRLQFELKAIQGTCVASEW